MNSCAQPVPKASLEFEEWEVVTVMKNVKINYEGHQAGERMYIGVATNHSYGEDVVCKGQVRRWSGQGGSLVVKGGGLGVLSGCSELP